MHDLGDLLLEGVTNSYEAGASKVEITLEQMAELVKVVIKDNGRFNPNEEVFSPGYSSKGEGRGMGLALIRNQSKCVQLLRVGVFTELSFQIEEDDSLERLEDMLFPVFQLVENITFKYLKDGREVLALKQEGRRPKSTKDIAVFKQLVRAKRRSV